ncbi:MAG TPA: hypothetical protein VH765_09275 [Xanthobacteraceae bacterium]|jgi:hypothetical protein
MNKHLSVGVIALWFLIALPGPPVPQASAQKGPLASADGEKPGTRVEVQELKRVSGGIVMLRFTLINDSGDKFGFGNQFTQQGVNESNSIGGVHLIDPAGKKKYLVVRDSQNNCDCSRKLAELKPKSSANLWARFPAPPDKLEKINVVIPHFAPLDDVPISR